MVGVNVMLVLSVVSKVLVSMADQLQVLIQELLDFWVSKVLVSMAGQ